VSRTRIRDLACALRSWGYSHSEAIAGVEEAVSDLQARDNGNRSPLGTAPAAPTDEEILLRLFRRRSDTEDS
jgi:hypothetical protein